MGAIRGLDCDDDRPDLRDVQGTKPTPWPSLARRIWDAKTDPFAPQYDPAWVGTEPPE